MEVSNTLLGMSLYETDKHTVIRWADVNMICSRRVKSYQDIKDLPKESEELFHASWIDTYYPSRPQELENTHLFDFLACYDVQKDEPKKEIYFLFWVLSCKKRVSIFSESFSI